MEVNYPYSWVISELRALSSLFIFSFMNSYPDMNLSSVLLIIIGCNIFCECIIPSIFFSVLLIYLMQIYNKYLKGKNNLTFIFDRIDPRGRKC